jgi:hypothetical protein
MGEGAGTYRLTLIVYQNAAPPERSRPIHFAKLDNLSFGFTAGVGTAPTLRSVAGRCWACSQVIREVSLPSALDRFQSVNKRNIQLLTCQCGSLLADSEYY